MATKENLVVVEDQKAKLIGKMEASKAKAVKKGELLSELKLSVKARVGEEGKLLVQLVLKTFVVR